MTLIPEQLLNSIDRDSFDRAGFIEAHREENKLTSVRLNPFKSVQLEIELNEKVKWCDEGYYLSSRPKFTLDPLFHAGAYYVQEAGSMFIDYALRNSVDLSRNLRVLDLCGAPGGKSTLLNSAISPDSLLVANELIKSRADILAQNLSRWGTCNTIVTNNETAKFSESGVEFDVIVVDAPCSGSGLFRKQPDAISEWSPESVIACSVRQKKILESILSSLTDDGILIYSTCSYSYEENEDIVKWLVETQGLIFQRLETNPDWGILETGRGYRFYPHLTKSEGFFCAVLRKNGQNHDKMTQKRRKTSQNTPKIEEINKFVKAGFGHFFRRDEYHYLVNNAVLDFLTVFEGRFYYKKAGTLMGTLKGGALVPDQELAWSIFLNDEVNRVELSEIEALKYLRKENLNPLPGQKGLALVTHKGLGLGWIKMLGNRTNNYLPSGLRILN